MKIFDTLKKGFIDGYTGTLPSTVESHNEPGIVLYREVPKPALGATIAQLNTLAILSPNLDLIKPDSWHLLAVIRHGITGEIIYGNCGPEYLVKPACDCCNYNSHRRYSFIVKKGNTIKQLGTNCVDVYLDVSNVKSLLQIKTRK